MQIIRPTTPCQRRAAIATAVEVLKSGGVVCHPTDTVFGLAADATNLAAVKKVHAIKKSDSKKPLLQIVPTRKMAKELAELSPRVRKIMAEFWPGPLALLLPMRVGSGKIGLRIPDHELSLTLARRLKKPITTTSANLTGQEVGRSADEIFEIFRRRKNQPDLILDFDLPSATSKKPSTILDCTDSKFQIVRQGAISSAALRSHLR